MNMSDDKISESVRVLLVDYQAEGAEYTVPLGCACIGSALLDTGHLQCDHLRIATPGLNENKARLAERFLMYKPAVIGFSLYCWNTAASVALAMLLKQMEPSLTLIAGGPDAEWFAGGNREVCPFDCIFLGPAEKSVQTWFLEYAGNNGAVAMAVVKPAGAVPLMIPPEPVDLEKIPSPWLDGCAVPPDNGEVLWELTRGCPYHCSYCYEGRGLSTVRHVPTARLEAELALFMRSGVEKVFVLDPTFNLQRDRTLSLLSMMKEKGGGIFWNFEIRAELLDARQAKAFGELDCSLQIGLQSAQKKVMENIGRSLDRGLFAKKVDLLNQAGVVFGFDLIYGLPGDSLKGFRDSLDFALSLYPNHLDLFPLSVLPGTSLYEQIDQYQLDCDPNPPYRLKGQPGFPAADMAKAEEIAHACDIFYTLGRAVPWFNAVLQPLDLRPSAFFQKIAGEAAVQFPGFRDASELLHADIEAFQCKILRIIYEQQGKASMLPAVLDLVRYNGALSRAFAEDETTKLQLSYPLPLVDGGEILDVEGFSDEYRVRPCTVMIRPGKDGPVVKIV
ncbi:MAG: radical SAM protein [Spirochaetaceae bacterium]|nr:radical SAM protein [Spirochaetaceae bacterium]